MLAYLCTRCSIIFWLGNSVVNPQSEEEFIPDIPGPICCPRCHRPTTIVRDQTNDVIGAEEL